MMGSVKLSTIRAELRKSFDMSDADLLAWFDRQIEEAGQTPKGGPKEIETLRLLRDALVVEVKRPVPESVAIPEK
jgi:hypothetical protein